MRNLPTLDEILGKVSKPKKEPHEPRAPRNDKLLEEYKERLMEANTRTEALWKEHLTSLRYYRDWNKKEKRIEDNRQGTIATVEAIEDSIKFVFDKTNIKGKKELIK